MFQIVKSKTLLYRDVQIGKGKRIVHRFYGKQMNDKIQAETKGKYPRIVSAYVLKIKGQKDQILQAFQLHERAGKIPTLASLGLA